MSNVALFALGTAVTLLVISALGLLVWGAILDGRDEQERRRAASAPAPGRAEAEPVEAIGVVDAA